MKTVYLDCFAGISGDMLVGTLIDLGVSPETLTTELGKLALEGEYRIQISRVNKRGIQAVQFKVLLASPAGELLADTEFLEMDLQSGLTENPSLETGHEHPHEHMQEHEHKHEHGHEHTHEHRSLPQIITIIEASTLSPFVKQTAREVFTRLAEAEGKVHGVPPDKIHFHEVGGVDAIIDIVSVAIGMEQLGIEQVIASPLHLGGGFVNIQHGLYPVPAPATANLLTGVPVYTSEIKGELVTPTGAATLTTIAKRYGAMPVMTVETVGYGAGTRDRAFPNVLRGFLGETSEPSGRRKSRTPFENQHADPPGPAGYHTHSAVMIEANLDDMTPLLFENLMEKLLEVGALDVWFVPIQMKKNRPGMLLQVLAHPTSVDDLAKLIFRESTSIGLRTYEVTKRMLQREKMIVQTPYGPVGVKLAYLGGERVNTLPEYEDCRELSNQSGIPLKEIYTAACVSASEQIKSSSAAEST